MARAARYDADTIRVALTGAAIVDHFGLRGRRAGAELRTRECPACGPRGSEAVAIHLPSGRWIDHVRGCAGDGFALVAALAGLDARFDFAAVLALAATIAGVDPDADSAPAARRERVRAARAREAAQDARQAIERAAAIDRARGMWAALARDDARGRAYLDRRGLDSAALIACDAVRFVRDGSPAVALRDLDGKIVNVVTRRIDPGDGPKVAGLRAAPTEGTLIGAVSEIVGGSVAVVVEGVADALAAALAWPGAVVLGAHGAGRYAGIARLAAPRVRLARGRMLLCTDADPVGERAGVEAGRAALDAGLELDRDLLVVDFGAAHDLADAWRGGWRP